MRNYSENPFTNRKIPFYFLCVFATLRETMLAEIGYPTFGLLTIVNK